MRTKLTVSLLAAFVLAAAQYPLLADTTERASVASDGTQGDGASSAAFATADGRYIVFNSEAANLVSGDTNGQSDVFIRDRQTGEIERVSVATDGSQGDNWSSGGASSDDGRYVAFYSAATTLVAGDTNGVMDVFLRDRETGETVRVSVAPDGTPGDGSSWEPAISADGRYVAYCGSATNLVPGDTNGKDDVFVHDRETGVTERVSVASDGTQGNWFSRWPSISTDGRFVAFHADASCLVPGDTNGKSDVFLHDRQTGTTERISLTSGGSQGNGNSFRPSISAGGRYVAFDSFASDLVPADTNERCDVFVRDRQLGRTDRVSVATDGSQANYTSRYCAISGDGRYVVFRSYANNLVSDGNNKYDIFLHDRDTEQTQRVSVSSSGTEANGDSHYPHINSDGRCIVFQSAASNLVSADTNGVEDVFVRDRLTADFAADTTSGPPPLSVAFSDLSVGGPTSWEWAFGDGGTSTSQSPSHDYLTSGGYTVSLTVQDGVGSDTETKSDYITVTAPPAAAFSGSPTSGTAPLTVDFTDLSLNDPTSWEWDFGDGGTSADQNPSHEYTLPGSYTVSMTATNAAGSDGVTKPDYIVVTPLTPEADFSGSPTLGTAPLTVDFTDLSTNTPTSWEWDFGDGGTSGAQHPSHEYTLPGSYTVELTAANAAGSDTETKSDYVTALLPAPTADFSCNTTEGPAPLTVDFTDLSTNDPTSWEWDFGDGGTATAQNPTHQYDAAGSYTVCLSAANAGGSDAETKVDYIVVLFPDAALDHWAWSEILACVAAGIVQGYEDGLYHPEYPVDRGQMAAYVARALAGGDGNVPEFTETPTFPDVGADHWAIDYVEYAADANVVGGYPDGTYMPEAIVTRDQMAVYMARSICDPTGEDGLVGYVPADPRNFPDVAVDHWAYIHIEYCVENEVVQGYPEGDYKPDLEVTRDQMAVYVARAFGLLD